MQELRAQPSDLPVTKFPKLGEPGTTRELLEAP